MKKTLYAIICGSLLMSACNKNDTAPAEPINNPTPVDNTTELQYNKKTSPVLLEYTSVYCGGCGSWGKPTFKEFVEQNKADVTPLAIHIKYGDPFITDISNGIGDNRYGQYYTPQIWVADSNAVTLSGGGIISDRSKQNAARILAASKAMVQPSLSAKMQKEGNELKVDFGVKFIDVTADGEYALGCYLTEDGLEHYQVQYKDTVAIHDHVIRASNEGVFGKPFTEADLDSDKELKLSHTFDISNYVADNTYITLVIWKKTGNRYMPVNGFVLK